MHDAEYFFSELIEIQKKLKSNHEPKLILKDLYSLFYEFIFFFLQRNPQYFPSNFSRIIFIINNFKPKEEIKRKLLVCCSLLSKGRKQEFERKDISDIIYILADIFSYFLKKSAPSSLIPPESHCLTIFDKFLKNYISTKDLVNLRRVFVEGVNPKANSIVCYDEFNHLEIDCSYKWTEIPKVVSQGTTLNCFGLLKTDEGKFATCENSLIVIEPDYLYDITDISQCFTKKGTNAYLYFLNKFFPKQTSYYTFLGTIVNLILDLLLVEKEISFEDAIQKAISKKILSFIVLKQKDPNFEKNLYSEVQLHFSTLKKVAEIITKYPFQIEPAFFSADYGINGRMDILLESKTVPKWKTIVELKSGTPPTNHFNVSISSNQSISTAMWISHYAQTIGYNLLLDSAIPERKGSSMILYSKDSIKPLREAINTINLQREFIKTRNWIFLLESQLARGKFQILETLNKYLQKENNGYFSIKNYIDLLHNSNDEIKTLIQEYIKFTINENILAKIGEFQNYNRSSQSSIWNIAFEDKNELDTTLVNLKINLEKSNFEKDYLYFDIIDQLSSVTSLRKGDPVIVYHPMFIQNPYSFQLLKGAIKDIEPNFVVVTLRNKFSEQEIFNQTDGWIIEQDYIETTTRSLFYSLFNFLLVDPNKMDIIIGKKGPELLNISNIETKSEIYTDIINMAIRSYPYFLVIGPPGTGKTRIVVRGLLKYYLFNTNQKILVCTYTNRAVDEIVEVLKNENCQNFFIRIGNKEASEYTENMLSHLTEQISKTELEHKILNSRVYLGTAYSFLTNPEIFELNKFDLAIIDEASQLLFPHIAGILAQVDKFILIGDEKQLPAVVLQNFNQTETKNPLLKAIGYDNLAISYFEFLLNRIRQNGWTNSIGILDLQSRMHPEVLSPINSFFYEGVIKTNPKRNSNVGVAELISFIQKKLNLSTNSRIVFIDLPCEKRRKSNKMQANLIANIINECFDKYNKIINQHTFGVISPYRIQNAEIYSLINPEIRKIVTIDTIERFQGSEREIIFLSLPFNRVSEIKMSSSMVKTEKGKTIDRKLNVALTRAKEFLVILGNFDLLSQSIFYKDFLKNFFDGTNLLKLE